jgi:hypothetical protein
MHQHLQHLRPLPLLCRRLLPYLPPLPAPLHYLPALMPALPLRLRSSCPLCVGVDLVDNRCAFRLAGARHVGQHRDIDA